MINYKKIINNLTNLFQLSLLTTKDIKQEIINLIQFKKEKIMNELNNSHSRDLEELKNKINNLKLEIRKLKKLVGKG
jgi:cell division protein FtsB